MNHNDTISSRFADKEKLYKHYTGGIYEVLSVACDNETYPERYVVYKDKDNNEWIRCYDSFHRTLGDETKRFVKLEHNECGEKRCGHTLDDCPDDKYDWKLMAMEELIDLVQYQQKEIVRLERLMGS